MPPDLLRLNRVDVPHRSVSEQQPEEKEEVKIQATCLPARRKIDVKESFLTCEVQSPTHKELAPPKKPKSALSDGCVMPALGLVLGKLNELVGAEV